jgi:hypothetical protein
MIVDMQTKRSDNEEEDGKDHGKGARRQARWTQRGLDQYFV